MKNLKFGLVAMMIALFTVLGTNEAKAQITTGEDVIAAAGNLVNIQIGDVNVNAVDVVDVTNVLNGNDVRVIRDIIVTVEIDDTLNNLLRDAEIIKNNQVVVGVVVNALGGVEQVLVAKQGQLRK